MSIARVVPKLDQRSFAAPGYTHTEKDSAVPPALWPWAGLALLLAASLLVGFYWIGFEASSADAAVSMSFLTSSVSCLPLIVWAKRAVPSAHLGLLILGWIPMKLLFLWLAPSEEIAMGTGDWEPFHIYGMLFSEYWRAGGDWFPPHEIIQQYSMKYPGAVHLFGIPYLIFGQYGYVVIPWLGFIQLITASIAFNLFMEAGLGRRLAVYAMLYLLYCPAWLALTNMLFRDILLMLGLVVFIYGILQVTNKKWLGGLVAVGAGFILVILLREQYFLLLAGFSLVALVMGRGGRWISCLAVAIAAIGGYYFLETLIHPEMGGTIIERMQFNFEESSAVEVGAAESFVSHYGPLVWYLLPIAIPFRFLVAIVAPFPWTNMDPTLAQQAGESWLYAGFHILQALIHLSLGLMLLTFFESWRDKLARVGNGGLLVLVFGLSLALASTLSYVGYSRNVLLAFLFFLPVVNVAQGHWEFRNMFMFSVVLLIGLHIAYYGLR